MKRVDSKIFLSLFFFLFALGMKAQDVVPSPEVDKDLMAKKSNYQLDSRYKGGEFLIFQCSQGFYACVDQDGYDNCTEKRQAAKKDKAEVYPCAPLKKFEDKKSCLRANYGAVESVAKKRFCYPE